MLTYIKLLQSILRVGNANPTLLPVNGKISRGSAGTDESFQGLKPLHF